MKTGSSDVSYFNNEKKKKKKKTLWSLVTQPCVYQPIYILNAFISTIIKYKEMSG